MQKKQKMIRKEIYTIEDVLAKRDVYSDGETSYKKKKSSLKVNFDGDIINMGSLRYQTFAEKGVKCAYCGVEGRYFAKEKHPNSNSVSYHFNLYAIDDNGDEILMTKDHILPKSKGGLDNIDNMQTMCTLCNQQKKDNVL